MIQKYIYLYEKYFLSHLSVIKSVPINYTHRHILTCILVIEFFPKEFLINIPKKWKKKMLVKNENKNCLIQVDNKLAMN